MGKVLITGGAGFIGTHLSEKLISEGVGVRVIDSLTAQVHGHVPSNISKLLGDQVEFVRSDINEQSELDKALIGIESIVHLASETGTAQSMYELSKYCEANIVGTAKLLEAVSRCETPIKRIVLASSRSVYGEGVYCCEKCDATKRIFPSSRKIEHMKNGNFEFSCKICGGSLKPLATSEGDETSPASLYAATKLMQENMLNIYSDATSIPIKIFRLQNVFGEGQSLVNPYTGILSNFCLKILNGVCTPIFEDGQETRDFVHVGNVAEVIYQGLLTNLHDGDVINVGSGIPLTIEEVAKKLHKLLNKKCNYKITGQFRAGDIRHNWAVNAKMMSLIGADRFISVDDGLTRLARWMESQNLPEDMLGEANQELIKKNLLFDSKSC